MKRMIFLSSLLVVLALAFSTHTAAAQDATASETMTATEQMTGAVQIPFLDDWMGSGHADATAMAFNDWNEEDPAVVPETCAKCHSSTGYQDFLGADGSEAGKVDAPAPIGSVVDCVACHNSATVVKTSVVMPSGIELTGLGDESRCMECHQGRQSKVSVDKAITDAAVPDEDTVSDKLSFRNIHYFAAAATKYGTLAKGGYEYEGQTYEAQFAHVDGYQTCIQCHNAHTLEVKVEECATCHEGVAAVEDLKNVRMAGSTMDYDGDGDVEEGIAFEIEGLQETLMAAIQSYAANVAGSPIAYDSAAYPYFFADTNANGTVDEDEAIRDNGYKSFTARLVKATYNYQTSLKDPGAFAHGGKYIIQLLHDSIADLNTKLAEPIDNSAAVRNDAGHFSGSAEAFRHWDAEGKVPGSCAKCHSAGGIPQLLAEGVNISAPPSNGFQCATCHNDLKEFTRHEFTSVKFPSGAVIESEDLDMNLCLNCHQGRESTVSVNKLIGDAEADTVSDKLRFLNPHYFAAGATRYGTEAKGAYEYDGKEYAGFFEHGKKSSCVDCHDGHNLTVKWDTCTECHEEVTTEEEVANIRYNYADYNGNGDDQEGMKLEVDSLEEMLLPALQAYAAETVGTPIAYSPTSYPYFFNDTNANGAADPEEANNDNRYVTWTPRLLRAAYNYQYVQKDPGSFAHNGVYILQVLYDSLEDVGADVSALTRP